LRNLLADEQTDRQTNKNKQRRLHNPIGGGN